MADINEKLSDRSALLLKTLTRLYIQNGIPVSSTSISNTLSEEGITIPPSTVRLELSALENSGYFIKTHSSSGRVPTANAYRIYVNSLDPHSITSPLTAEILDACRALSGELGRLLDYAGEVLANESGCLGFVTSPNQNEAKIARFKIDHLEENMILLRLELKSGRIYSHLSRMSPSIQNLRLPDLAEFLSERTSGRKLGDVTESEIEALVKHLAEWGRGYDTLVHPLHDLIMDARLGESPRTIMYGAAGLLKASGDNADSLARAVELLDNRTSFEKTLGQVPGDEKVRVYIGGREFIPENRGDALLESILEGFALVVGTYHLHSRSAGQLGIVGPLRTPYEHHLGLVRSVADTISRTLIARELGFHSN